MSTNRQRADTIEAPKDTQTTEQTIRLSLDVVVVKEKQTLS
jgi:hypothetical protein